MRLFGPTLLVCAVSVFGQAQPSGLSSDLDLAELKRMEVERLRAMAENGSVSRSRLDQAQAELADARDNMILRRTLYGSARVEDFTREQSDQMVAAAERLVQRQEDRYARTQELVNAGLVARATLAALLEDLQFRRKALDLARYRAELVQELAEYAAAEEQIDLDAPFRTRGMVERFDGRGAFTDLDFARVNAAFQRQFARPIPVSARGETATHRSLGFDHRGRVDVALNPDQPEGIWLIHQLRKLNIPYYAFRAAVSGKATGPHIHLGPPSLRIRLAD